MNLEGRVLSLAVCCAGVLVAGCATALVNTAPRPGSDFPNSESFYPYPARVWAQEGVADVHYCVDANGRLSSDPTLEDTSGDHDLDTAALALAKAGDGRYLPGSQAGKAVAGCADFKVRFILKDDPAFPTLSRRWKQLTNQLRPQWLLLESEFQQVKSPAALATFVSGDQEQLKQLRNFVATVSPLVKNFDALLADYVAKMDEIGRADDVSMAERTAFSKHWANQRAYLGEMREAVFDMQAMVATVDDLVKRVESAYPSLGPESGKQEPTERLGAEIGLLILRGRIECQELEARLNKIADGHAKIVARLGSGQGVESSTYERIPDKTVVVLEAVGSAGDLTTATANTTVPLPITEVKDIPGCAFPDNLRHSVEHGIDLFQVRLSDKGAVSSIELERTSGAAELDAIAQKCVSSMRFHPAVQGGKPVASVIQFPFEWVSDWETLRKGSCDEFKPKADAQVNPSSNTPKAASVILCTCWEESGRTEGPRIIGSSGFPRFDEGALKLGQSSGFGKPRPPGHPGCYAYRTKFELHQ
jgi:outer membrane biosynthesis protein TonB